METVLRSLLTGTRGGRNRVRILRALDERPRNANRLAEDLNLDYKTIRHHLGVLVDNGVVEVSDDDYGAVYSLTDRTRHNWETVTELVENA
ncbi:MAG: winged helix-turn-helix domain-containing protein [Haloferacaceae archaeon]